MKHYFQVTSMTINNGNAYGSNLSSFFLRSPTLTKEENKIHKERNNETKNEGRRKEKVLYFLAS